MYGITGAALGAAMILGLQSSPSALAGRNKDAPDTAVFLLLKELHAKTTENTAKRIDAEVGNLWVYNSPSWQEIGGGWRAITNEVTFASPFRETPNVLASLRYLSADGREAVTLFSIAEAEITTKGFKMVVQAHDANSPIIAANCGWVAIGKR
jgi:hypothetical protein